jgi:hypothetical protein
MNKHIVTLLEGKSESQVKNHARHLMQKGTLKIAKIGLWTKEEDAIIISNKNDKKTNKHIATLLEGRSESQVQYRSATLIEKGTLKIAKIGLWTEEEDAIIISNKNKNKTNKEIATLLEGRSEPQVQYRYIATLIEKGTLKMVAKNCSWTEEEDTIIIKNKNKNKTNKEIAMLLDGKSESQIKSHCQFLISKGTLKTVAKTIAKKCLWTEEEDAIIISNKIDNNTHKFIATLLEGRSESQVQYRSRILIDKGTLKMVAKKKKAPITKVRFHINK